jgi:transposase
MKKLTTMIVQWTLNKQDGCLSIGLDLGDRSSFYCVLDEAGEVLLEQKVSTTPKAIKEIFGAMPRSRIALETGTHSPWVSRLLRYPEAERLKQIKGVGTLIALTYMLTLEDPHRFRKSRDAACYVGLQPGRRNSGQSEPQMHISKEGDPYLRALLVQAAHHVLGPWGVDSDLRRWGMKLAEHGGKRGKKRAVIAVARKLAVLLHRLWMSGEVYVPLRPSGRATLPAVA